MASQWNMVTLLLALGGRWSLSELCPGSPASSFNFVINSQRNLTGHWTVEVDATRDSAQFTQPGISFQVAQDFTSCEHHQRLQLKSTAVVNEPTTVPDTNIRTTPRDKLVTTTSQPPPKTTQSPSTTTQSPSTKALSEVKALPPGYTLVNGVGYYKFQYPSVTWEQARDKCQKEGAHLMILNSEGEAEVYRTLYTQHRSQISSSGSTWVFLGFHDRDVQGQYTTVQGTQLNTTGYGRWSSEKEHSKLVRDCGAATATGELVDAECGVKRVFICEFESQQ